MPRAKSNTVYCTQVDDGLQIGLRYPINPVVEGETDTGLLQRKFASHQGYGWSTLWVVPGVKFQATKLYPENPLGVVGSPRQRVRIFEIL